jgi:hypothetical protein
MFKSVDKLGLPNMRADIAENVCTDLPGATSRIEDVEVATVPLMAVFKICAIARSYNGGRAKKVTKDVEDLEAIIEHMKTRGEVVSDTLLQLMNYEPTPFL